jgi:hypothetical protein
MHFLMLFHNIIVMIVLNVIVIACNPMYGQIPMNFTSTKNINENIPALNSDFPMVSSE